MRVKLFSVAAATPIQSLENDINEFLESERPHVTYVSVSSSDIERVLGYRGREEIVHRDDLVLIRAHVVGSP